MNTTRTGCERATITFWLDLGLTCPRPQNSIPDTGVIESVSGLYKCNVILE